MSRVHESWNLSSVEPGTFILINGTLKLIGEQQEILSPAPMDHLRYRIGRLRVHVVNFMWRALWSVVEATEIVFDTVTGRARKRRLAKLALQAQSDDEWQKSELKRRSHSYSEKNALRAACVLLRRAVQGRPIGVELSDLLAMTECVEIDCRECGASVKQNFIYNNHVYPDYAVVLLREWHEKTSTAT